MTLVKSKHRVADHGEVFTPAWLVEAMQGGPLPGSWARRGTFRRRESFSLPVFFEQPLQ